MFKNLLEKVFKKQNSHNLATDTPDIIEDSFTQSSTIDTSHYWNPVRMKVSELLFGRDAIHPLGNDYSLSMIKAFGLNENINFLDLNCGFGGLTRFIADSYGVWTTGMETDQLLVDEANRRAQLTGLHKKAPALFYDPESLRLRKNYFDGILARESFFKIKNKIEIIETINRGLKSFGHFAFTDYIINPDRFLDDYTDIWSASELVDVYPWSHQDYVDNIQKFPSFEIRIEEDVTDKIAKDVKNAWQRILEKLSAQKFEKIFYQELIKEYEKWFFRLRLIEQDAIRIHRFYILKGSVKAPTT